MDAIGPAAPKGAACAQRTGKHTRSARLAHKIAQRPASLATCRVVNRRISAASESVRSVSMMPQLSQGKTGQGGTRDRQSGTKWDIFRRFALWAVHLRFVAGLLALPSRASLARLIPWTTASCETLPEASGQIAARKIAILMARQRCGKSVTTRVVISGFVLRCEVS